MGLSSKSDFWTEEKKPSLSNRDIQDRGTSFEILLAHGPTAYQRFLLIKPGNRFYSYKRSLWKKSEDRASSKININFFRHSVSQRI